MSMKLTKVIGCAVVSSAALFLSSCATDPSGPQARFHQQEECDAIVHFSSWNLVTIKKPDTREAGFLPLYRFADAEKVLRNQNSSHRLAAVICGNFLSREQEEELQQKWAASFGGLGYQRVVFLRAGYGDGVNGLAVIRDMVLGQGQGPQNGG
jgi:hypothetical protein